MTRLLEVMPFDEFKKLFSECTREPYGFAVIVLTCKKERQKKEETT